MASSMNELRTTYQPLLNTTTDYLDSTNDQANIRVGLRTQQAISSRQRWQAYLSPNMRKRVRLLQEHDSPTTETRDLDLEISSQSKRISLPVRIAHRLINKDGDTAYDTGTIRVVTKRELRKIEERQKRQHDKVEKRKLDELAAQGRKQYYDLISRQLEVNEQERQAHLPHAPVRTSVKEKVKNTLKKSIKVRRHKPHCALDSGQIPITPQCAPHIDDFASKSQLQSYFRPSDFEAAQPQSAQTIPDTSIPAELPAVSISPPYDFKGSVGKRHSDDGHDMNFLPLPVRSLSPCSSSIPRRGITLSETPHAWSNKQMQCDYCHDAIKLTGFHYACTICDDGDRLYCAKCANDGRTCRHKLIERTRNIQRHPTNPQHSHHFQERRIFSSERASVTSGDVHAELSALPQLETLTLSGATRESDKRPKVHQDSKSSIEASPTSSALSSDVFKDLETTRREQEIILREQHAALREREASLREREAVAASRERDATFIQQLQAAAMLQRERATEVGAQFFTTPSRHSSYGARMDHIRSNVSESRDAHSSINTATDCMHYQSGCKPRSSEAQSALPLPKACSIHQARRPGSSYDACDGGVRLHSYSKGKKPNIEFVSALDALEASAAGIEMAQPIVRHHTNSTKRKASGAGNKTSSRASTNKKGSSGFKRGSSYKDNQKFDPDDQDGSEDSETGSPKRQKQDPLGPRDRRLFACPYFKFEPMRYAEGNVHELGYRGCAGGLFRDISRIKQHLKRNHHRPAFYCRRCFLVFETNEGLQGHSSQQESCNVELCPYPEKLDETQQKEIHTKRPGKDPKDLWYDIFKIIFPGAPVPSSPYIEPAEPKSSEQSILEHFIRSFETKLDASTSAHPWLASITARDFLRAQLRLTVQETMLDVSTHPPRIPPVLISPVSPKGEPQFLDSRKGSCSSRRSSSTHSTQVSQRPVPSLKKLGCSLRPALKVTTQATSSGSGSPLYSAKSQNGSQFPTLLSHVQDDLDRQHDVASGSWRSGDDVHIMSGHAQEPLSATSTRSTKSVKFVTPPPVMSWRENNETDWNGTSQEDVVDWNRSLAVNCNEDPCHTELSFNGSFRHDRADLPCEYLNTFDWSATVFVDNNGCTQPTVLKKPRSCPTDSAYGTLSSQPSHSSIFQKQHMEPHHGLHCQATCVDPQVLFVNPIDGDLNIPDMNADLQAYLNRNGETTGSQQ